MKWDSLYIEGFGSYLPEEREFAAEMVAAGRYSQVEHRKTGQVSAAVARPERGESAPEMAVGAGRAALADAGTDPADVGLDLLRRSGALTPGDRLLLTGIGVGFTWGCAVVEYTGAPAPAPATGTTGTNNTNNTNNTNDPNNTKGGVR
ncbi:3-oxoacyl-[acyl-carrier-protein] synthase III C-terminal domain-containing protein [Streptomyces sp. Agncl-13]|uniref:3-oxoacyl-[acyl-carrier-protein] synthase III C-terminal domain-containing protein n=1 Tax=Streptomyces sp. Agncl-13 TaxID=3400628 RepID=UPI003A86CAB4